MSEGGYSSSVGSGFDDIRSAYVDRSALRYLETDVAHLERAAVQRLRAREVHVTQGAVALAVGDSVIIRQSNAGIVVGKSVAADQLHTAILVSPVVRGDVHTVVDLRTAVAVGFGMGLARALIYAIRLIGRRLF